MAQRFCSRRSRLLTEQRAECVRKGRPVCHAGRSEHSPAASGMMLAMRSWIPALLMLLTASALAADEQQAQIDRYRAALKELARRRAVEALGYKTRSELARRQTGGKPVDLVLRDGAVVPGSQVVQLGPQGVHVLSESRKRTLRWSELSPASYVLLKRLGLPAGDATGFLALGRYCVRHGRYDDAARAFRHAVQSKPQLQQWLPELAQFRSPPRLSSGQLTRQEGRITVDLPFDTEEQADDLASYYDEDEVWHEKGQLRVASDLVMYLPNWMDRIGAPIVYDLLPGTYGDGKFLWVMLSYEQGVQTRCVYLLLDHTRRRYLLSDSAEDPEKALESLAGKVARGGLALQPLAGPAGRIRIRVEQARLVLSIGEKVLLDRVGAVSEPLLSFGGLSEDEEDEASIGFDRLVVSGRFSRERQRHTLAEKRSDRRRQLYAELMEEPEPVELPMLASSRNASLSADGKQLYGRLLTRLAAVARQPGELGERVRRRAVRLLARFGEKHPRFAPFYFWRGWFRSVQGETHQALEDFTRAIELDGGFVEAHAARARELAAIGLLKRAEKAARQTIELAPSNALARATMALVAFGRRQSVKEALAALDQLEVATILAPRNKELALELRQCRQVVAGPPWPGGSPPPMVRSRYTLYSDLPVAQRKRLLEELGRTRKLFDQFMPPREQPIRRAEVFVFSLRATYAISSALIGDEVDEETEGHFERTFQTLYLYRSHDDIDTGKLAHTLGTLRHEAWHQYVANLIPDLPAWADEALGEHFSSVRFGEDGPRFGIQLERLRSIVSWLETKPHMPFEKLMRSSDEAFMNYEVSYAQAWSMVYLFLMHAPARHRARFRGYLDLLRQGRSRDESFRATFGKVDLTALEKEWKAMLRQLASKHLK